MSVCSSACVRVREWVVTLLSRLFELCKKRKLIRTIWYGTASYCIPHEYKYTAFRIPNKIKKKKKRSTIEKWIPLLVEKKIILNACNARIEMCSRVPITESSVIQRMPLFRYIIIIVIITFRGCVVAVVDNATIMAMNHIYSTKYPFRIKNKMKRMSKLIRLMQPATWKRY